MKRAILLVYFVMLAMSLFAQRGCDGKRYMDSIFAEINVEKNIIYGAAKTYNNTNQVLKLDVYTPKNDTVALRPLIIWAHGGSFMFGTKEVCDVKYFSEQFAKRGYVCASIDYRLGMDVLKALASDSGSKVEVFKSCIRATQDAKASVRFFRQTFENGNPYGIDTSRIIFGGCSAGGFMALHLAYLNSEAEFSEMLQPQYLTEIGGLEGDGGNPQYSSKVKLIVNLSGAIGKAKWVNVGETPVIGMHGTADHTVPYAYGTAGMSQVNVKVPFEGSYLVDSFARARGVPTDFYSFVNGGHVPFMDGLPDTIRPAYMDTTFRYVRNHLAPYVCENYTVNSVNKPNIRSLKIYPSPAENEITLEIDRAPNEIIRLNLTDLTGRVVYDQKYEANEPLIIHRGDWSDGLYFIKAQSGSNVWQNKIIWR